MSVLERQSLRGLTHLELVEIIIELLEAFFECYEAGRDLRGCCTSRLHHPFLVEQSLKAELEL